MVDIAVFENGYAEMLPLPESTLSALGTDYQIMTQDEYYQDFDNEHAVKIAENSFKKAVFYQQKIRLPVITWCDFSIRYNRETKKFTVLVERDNANYWHSIKTDYGDARNYIFDTLENENKLCRIKKASKKGKIK